MYRARILSVDNEVSVRQVITEFLKNKDNPNGYIPCYKGRDIEYKRKYKRENIKRPIIQTKLAKIL